jgi:hypothetical protein
MPKPVPYVGVSGVVSPEQQQWIRETAQPIIDRGRALLLGVKAVHKNHWLEIENKYGPEHYPVGKDIGGSVESTSEDELLVAQVYLDLQAAAQEGESNYEVRFIDKLLGRAAWTGVQFDMLPWHENEYTGLFGRIKKEAPLVLLQCHGDIMQKLSPHKVSELLRSYTGLVDYVLFDASHGKGVTLNPDALEPFVDAASELTGIGVGVAGGLDERTVLSPEFQKLLAHYPDLSFDAEGKLRPEGKGALDQDATRAYLASAARVVRRSEHL